MHLGKKKPFLSVMNGSSTSRLENLGQSALENEEYEIAKDIYSYIIENTSDKIVQLDAELNLIDIELVGATDSTLDAIQKNMRNLRGYLWVQITNPSATGSLCQFSNF